MNIRQILESKPHNPHFLNRYIKFIDYCRSNPSTSEYIEAHHILPKAKDLFPEYSSFKNFRWNKILLSIEQHLLAHLLLWKAYGGSQAYAFHYMVNIAGEKTRIPSKFVRQYSNRLKLQAREARKGFSTYKDSEGKNFFLHNSDKKIKELGLVGANQGLKMTDEAKALMKLAKDPYRVVHMFFNGSRERKSVRLNSPEYEEHLKLGWELERSEESRFEAKESQKAAARLANTGTASYYYPNSGILYGRIPHDSPIIKELGLVHKRSSKQSAQAKEQAKLNAANAEVQSKKSKTISGLKWFYNPHTLEKARLETCPEGWLPGRKGSTTVGGTETWNDGIRNYRIQPGTQDPTWERGMVKRKKV